MKKFFVFCLSLMFASITLANCPDGGETSEFASWFCCKNGKSYNRNTKKYDKDSPYCGTCLNGGTPTLQKDGSVDCCKNNMVFNRETKEYDHVRSDICGCPDGGKPGTLGYACCKNDYQYNEKTHAYDYLNPGECGCPNGGTVHRGVGVNDGDVCCKNGYAHKYYFGESPVIYDEVDAKKCGCPDGSIPGSDGSSCCKDGFVVGNKYGPSVQARICGCPFGGTVVGQYHCMKDGFLWNDQSHTYNNVSAKYGCPPNSIEMGGICCQNSLAYNNDSGKFDLIDGRCGCPVGSTHSPWGATLLELSKDEKLPIIMSLCCKDGKMYNPLKEGFDQEIPFCKPVPADKEKVLQELLLMDLTFLSIIESHLH